jgi:hypothetical protein
MPQVIIRRFSASESIRITLCSVMSLFFFGNRSFFFETVKNLSSLQQCVRAIITAVMTNRKNQKSFVA